MHTLHVSSVSVGGTHESRCAFVMIALFTATSQTNELHTTVSISKNRPPESPRSWAGSQAVARTVLPQVLPCAHTAVSTRSTACECTADLQGSCGAPAGWL
uniref:Uncharacterized protein n=1 Tax=Haptolina brevifila TaxID=156173 RepID=A0A7S2JB43_9EUKA